MVDLCLRQILMDKLTLRDYEERSSVSWTDIRRRLLLNEREVNPTLPDHLYRAALDAQLDERGINYGFPLNSCNSSINRAVTFFIIGRGNEKATVLSSVFCVWIHSLKQLKLR